MKTITATRVQNSVIVRVYNKETKELTTDTAFFKGNLDEKNKAYIRAEFEALYNVMVCKFYEDTISKVSECKYAMPEEQFFNEAQAMEKRPNGDYISRTAKATQCKVTLYNNYSDAIEIQTRFASGTNADKIEKEIRKSYKNTDYTVLDIECVKTIEALYVMPAKEFFEKAVRVEK